MLVITEREGARAAPQIQRRDVGAPEVAAAVVAAVVARARSLCGLWLNATLARSARKTACPRKV